MNDKSCKNERIWKSVRWQRNNISDRIELASFHLVETLRVLENTIHTLFDVRPGIVARPRQPRTGRKLVCASLSRENSENPAISDVL